MNKISVKNKYNSFVPIVIEEKSGIQRIKEPITIGIPLEKGAIFDADKIILFDEKGHSLPRQIQILGRWSDKSIKWVLLDFQVDVKENESIVYQMQYCDTCTVEMPSPQVSIRQASDCIAIDTGLGEFFVDIHTLKPFNRVIVQGSDIMETNGSKMVLTDEAGRKYEPRIDHISFETVGPLRATLCIQGKLHVQNQPPFADFISNLSFYANHTLVELKFTLRNPNAAEHPGGLWDLGDEGSIYFKDLSLHTALACDDMLAIDWTSQPLQPLVRSDSTGIEIYQDSSGGQNWRSSNHINRFGNIMHVFQGYRVTADGIVIHEGKRATPVVSLCGSAKRIAGAVERFWQNFPKAIEVQNNRLTIRLFPRQYSDLYELQGGEQKTHTIFLQFDNSEGRASEIGWVHERLIPRATPEWFTNSKAIGYLTPHSHDKNSACLALVDSAIDGPNTFFHRREIIDEYGWRHFGDLYADHEAIGHQGVTTLVAHYNNQYDVIYGALVQYVRSGDLRWFHLMDDLAKHVMDIDIYHTQKDRQAYNGGMFWHTDHYTDAATATHRSYSKTSLGTQSRHLCGGGPSNEHNYTTGLLHYYFLTGNTMARDMVQGLADWVINMDDGSERFLGIFDRRPAGICSATVSRDYHGPGRGSGNSINALLDAYILTQENKYLSKAEQLIRRCIHPRDDIQSRNLDDIEYRWSYTIFLQSLGKYLDFKVEKSELDYMYYYARESLIHYSVWMLRNEVPYMHALDKVEIPTETWPAQDIRKSNVFKFAAKYAEEPLRSEFLERSEFFFNVCINDLMSFPTYNLTRPIVILMTNGFMHSYFQIHKDKMSPQLEKNYDLGWPQKFTPQFHELYKAREKFVLFLSTIKNVGRHVRSLLRSTQHLSEGKHG